jgi:hypothetical protein
LSIEEEKLKIFDSINGFLNLDDRNQENEDFGDKEFEIFKEFRYFFPWNNI